MVERVIGNRLKRFNNFTLDYQMIIHNHIKVYITRTYIRRVPQIDPISKISRKVSSFFKKSYNNYIKVIKIGKQTIFTINNNKHTTLTLKRNSLFTVANRVYIIKFELFYTFIYYH